MNGCLFDIGVHAMAGENPPPNTTILANRAGGDPAAADELMARVYDRLRRRAAKMVADDRAGRQIGATALVHQAYERLYLEEGGVPADRWASSGQFRAAFARTMQRVLIEHARSERRLKRGGRWGRVDLREMDAVKLYRADPDVVLDVHHAFQKLARVYPKCHVVAVQRVYGGLTVAEIAADLKVSDKTIHRRWAMAQAFLQMTLRGHSPAGGESSPQEDA
jgi:RNA polymerase sigma-70 factor (ECF subfamily)